MSAHGLELLPENIDTAAADPLEDSLAEIARRSCEQLSYNEFYWGYMKRNWPVILTAVSNDWECRQHWTVENKSSTSGRNTDTNQHVTLPLSPIQFDYLRKKIGNCRVPVANCSKEYFNSHQKCEMQFFNYLDYWQSQCYNRNSDETLENLAEGLNHGNNTENLYLKDWHLRAQMPDYKFYKVPNYFAADWLNEYLIETKQDDYRFVYMGPKDSWTPFHADVFGSYSWSTNIIGRKKWLLLRPGEELKLSDALGNLPFRIDEQLLQKKQVKFFVIIQTENEAIFVPSGWYHQVWNLTDTISVNHNWFNACNLPLIWHNLATNMDQVVEQIDDCRQMDNFDEHCQTMLRASFGINFMDFLNILEHITASRLQRCANNNLTELEVESSTALILFDTYTLNDFHVRHDLQTIYNVVEEMLQNLVICDSRTVLYRRCLSLQELTKNF